jgi:ABC-type uncharacterized transport system substrate-binding protein
MIKIFKSKKIILLPVVTLLFAWSHTITVADALPNPLREGIFTIGIAKGIPTPTWKPLKKELVRWGYEEGKNLKIVPVDLSGANNPLRQQELIHQLDKIDLFFATGNVLPKFYPLPELKTPVLFISIEEAVAIPDAIKDNFTGVIRGSYVSVISMAHEMLGEPQRMGFIFRNSSNMAQRTLPIIRKVAKEGGLTLDVQTINSPEEIDLAMAALKESSDFVLLFPPVINNGDIPHIVKAQNQLKLPVISQLSPGYSPNS